MRRRDFLVRGAASAGAILFGARGVAAQARGAAEQQSGSSNLFEMNQGAAKRVTRPAKTGATAALTNDERDTLERGIRCQCGCTLDVYVCRTTDFSCQVSPAMHRDIVALIEGGYSADEIVDAFVETYGERALMAPKKEGFNWAGYIVPFAAIAAGGAALVTVLRGMQRRAAPARVASAEAAPQLGSEEELARLEAAVRRDD